MGIADGCDPKPAHVHGYRCELACQKVQKPCIVVHGVHVLVMIGPYHDGQIGHCCSAAAAALLLLLQVTLDVRELMLQLCGSVGTATRQALTMWYT
jgi:hypothetical protein